MGRLEELRLLYGHRVPVLDKGWVELLDTMPNYNNTDDVYAMDRATVQAARTSFLGESKGDEKDKNLLGYLLRNRHNSVFEQVEFKFRVRAPLVTWWQWSRHRTWHMNAQSGRYVAFEENDFYVPDEWRLQSQNNKQASDGVLDRNTSDLLTKNLLKHYDESFKLYRLALKNGVAREQARLFLPGFSVYYTWVVKVDAHNLMHFLKLRMAQDAQYEIRVYADAIYNNFFKPMMPWTSEAIENEQ